MKRRFVPRVDKKVEWRVLSDDDVLLDSRIAPNEKKAWLESATAMKMLAKGKHIKFPRKKIK